MPKITFTKHPEIYQVAAGTDLVRLPHIYPTIPLTFGCCQGECGVCAIEIASGTENLTKCTKQEEKTLKKKGLPANYRLACQCALKGDIAINGPDEKEPHIHSGSLPDLDNTNGS